MRKTIAFAFENINCDKFFINTYAGYLCVRQAVELRRWPLDQPNIIPYPIKIPLCYRHNALV